MTTRNLFVCSLCCPSVNNSKLQLVVSWVARRTGAFKASATSVYVEPLAVGCKAAARLVDVAPTSATGDTGDVSEQPIEAIRSRTMNTRLLRLAPAISHAQRAAALPRKTCRQETLPHAKLLLVGLFRSLHSGLTVGRFYTPGIHPRAARGSRTASTAASSVVPVRVAGWVLSFFFGCPPLTLT